MERTSYFRPELFEFFRELAGNNNRPWFEANKKRYQADVRDPILRFVAGFEPHLHQVSPHFVADPRPVGGSLFRIYRDTRFSKDKTPYKTSAGVHFYHAAGHDVPAPGFYMHLGPGEVFAGGGLWQPDSTTVGKVREAIVAQPKRWERAVSGKEFTTQFELWGEKLKRPPSGYDPHHPFIEDLKRKDFVVTAPLSEEAACGPDFMDRVTEICRRAGPFMEFLTKAVGLPW